VLFVAGWLDAKGSFTLPRLWSQVRARRPDARLTLVGTGASEAAVLSAFAPEDRASVTVIPRLTGKEEMIEQFETHDLFLMPSLNEGSPLALLEAMAAGLPIVAGRAGGIPDIVMDGEHGLLFDPLDPDEGAARVLRLLDDRDERIGLARAAQERARSLDWAAAADVLERAAARVLGASPAKPLSLVRHPANQPLSGNSRND